jgi:hypothetical protein
MRKCASCRRRRAGIANPASGCASACLGQCVSMSARGWRAPTPPRPSSSTHALGQGDAHDQDAIDVAEYVTHQPDPFAAARPIARRSQAQDARNRPPAVSCSAWRPQVASTPSGSRHQLFERSRPPGSRDSRQPPYDRIRRRSMTPSPSCRGRSAGRSSAPASRRCDSKQRDGRAAGALDLRSVADPTRRDTIDGP